MKLSALYVLAACAVAGYAQDTVVSTSTYVSFSYLLSSWVFLTLLLAQKTARSTQLQFLLNPPLQRPRSAHLYPLFRRFKIQRPLHSTLELPRSKAPFQVSFLRLLALHLLS